MNGREVIPNSILGHPEVRSKSRVIDETPKKSMDLIDQLEAWMGKLSKSYLSLMNYPKIGQRERSI